MEKSAGAIIFRKEPEKIYYLLLHYPVRSLRAKREYWDLPKGHIEKGEKIEDTVKREVQEETGISIKNIRRGSFTNDIFEKEGKHYVTLFVVADYASGKVEVMEPERCERWDWFEWNRLPLPLFIPIQNLLKQGFDPTSSL